MVELTEDIIDVLKRVKDAIKDTEWKINNIGIRETGANGIVLDWDLRLHEEKSKKNDE